MVRGRLDDSPVGLGVVQTNELIDEARSSPKLPLTLGTYCCACLPSFAVRFPLGHFCDRDGSKDVMMNSLGK